MYDALIIANGDIPAPAYWQHLRYQTLICADAAALSLQTNQRHPDFIIGDMDSMSQAQVTRLFAHCRTIFLAEQETTDFEKALNFAQQQAFSRVLCLGLLGKAADHTLYNLSLLLRYAQSLCPMAGHVFEQTAQWIFPLGEHTHLITQPGATISFFPFELTVLSSQGLKWELQQDRVMPSLSCAIRNQATRAEVLIECQGACLCFISTPGPFLIPPTISI